MRSIDGMNYDSAISAYKAAIQAPSLGDDITLDLKVAATYSKLGRLRIRAGVV